VRLCEIFRGFGDIMRQIDCRVHYHYNGGHPRRRLYLTQLIDGNFGRKREKAGNYRSTQKGKGEKRKKSEEIEKTEKESSVTPTGLLVSNVIYLPCTRIKNLHYCATMLRRRALLPNRDLQLGTYHRPVATYGVRLWAPFFLSCLVPRSPPSSTTRGATLICR